MSQKKSHTHTHHTITTTASAAATTTKTKHKMPFNIASRLNETEEAEHTILLARGFQVLQYFISRIRAQKQ
jgi:hypothetical protein